MTMAPSVSSRWPAWLRAVGIVCAMAGPFSSPAEAQKAPPPGWRWGTDHPGRMTTEWNVPDTSWHFVQMAPGWHVTTRPGAIMYDPTVEAVGNYVLESVQILFPGTSQSGYGLFFGGRNLDSPEARYFTFLARRDGHISIEEHRNTAVTVLIPWTSAPSVHQVTGDNTARNVLRVVVRRDSLLFEVNAAVVAALARPDLPVEGHFGLRTGPNLNLHVTTLDYTRRLAPVPKR